MNELEIIRFGKIDGIRMFFNTLEYRTGHCHEEWEIVLVIENDLMVLMNQKKIHAKPGDILVFPPYTLHELHKQDRPCTFLCLQVSTDVLKQSQNLRQLTLEYVEAKNWFDLEQYKQLQIKMLKLMRVYLAGKPLFELDCTARACSLLYTLFTHIPYTLLNDAELDKKTMKNDRLTRFQKFVDDNYQYKIKLSDFADQENVTMTYMSTFLKKELNVSFRDYVSQVRFYAALKLLRNHSMSLQEISYECGFSDYRYFSRVFQEKTGLTPAEYRKAPVPVSGMALHVHQSIHSLETFYTLEVSQNMLNSYLQTLQESEDI